jgi:hypothetical protein
MLFYLMTLYSFYNKTIELQRMYSPTSIIRMIKSRKILWEGHVARMGKRNACRILVGNPEEKRLLGRPRRRWLDNIEVDLREICWGGIGWIDLAWNGDQGMAFVNTVMNLPVS